MKDSLIELIYKTYYREPLNNDILKLLKIICDVSEEVIVNALKDCIPDSNIDFNPDSNIDFNPDSNIELNEDLLIQENRNLNEMFLAKLEQRQLSGDQRSAEWLNQRVNYITASVSAACAGLMGAESRETQILNKASMGSFISFTGGYYTDMGNIFENITADHYSSLNKTKVHDYRLIPHYNKEYAFLGASTDGVTDELINIEIKTLAGRHLDSKIKKEYAHQMQHQMECLNLKVSHFLEAKYDTCKSLKDCQDSLKHGIILEFWVLIDKRFEYMYINDNFFREHEEAAMIREEKVYIRSIYWKMIGYQQKTVLYDKKWIVNMGPAFKAFWEEVLYLRENKDKLQARILSHERAKSNRKDAKAPLKLNKCLI